MMINLEFVTATLQEHAFSLIFLALLSWLAQSYYHSRARKLKQFPAVGPTLPILSLLGTFNYFKNVSAVVEAGVRKWPGRMFKVSTPTDWWVVLTDPKHIGEVARAPEHVWSSSLIVDEHIQARFTIGPQISTNRYHVPIVKNQLTKAIPNLIPDLYDEVVSSFEEFLPPDHDCSSIKVLENMANVVARATNRVFVGAPLCRNPEWLKLIVDVTNSVMKTAFILGLLPPILRPAVNFLISNLPRRYADGLKLLGPAIAARRIEREKKGTEIPSDLLTWLMDEAKDEEQQDRFLVARVFLMNFASIHTSSMATTQALFDLASFPEYLKPLREEVEAAIQLEGWTKAALDQMHKLDSFVKESQRLHPGGSLMMVRSAVKDYTFSDGTTIPADTIVAISTAIHLDSDHYEDPLKFDGFRYIKLKESATLDGHPSKRFDMVNTSVSSLAFSHGRHACPGRFFAATLIKLVLAHVIINYDVKLAGGGVRPVDRFLLHFNIPDPSAEIIFTRR